MKQYPIRESFHLSFYLVKLNHNIVVYFLGLRLILIMDAHSITYLENSVEFGLCIRYLS